MFVILTEKKQMFGMPELEDKVFYSHVRGLYSRASYATRYGSYEETREDVRKIRKANPAVFVNAIRYDWL